MKRNRNNEHICQNFRYKNDTNIYRRYELVHDRTQWVMSRPFTNINKSTTITKNYKNHYVSFGVRNFGIVEGVL